MSGTGVEPLEILEILELETLPYDTLSDKGYTSVPRCHGNSDASQDALKLVPDSSF